MIQKYVALARDARVASAAASVMPKGNAVDALVAGVLAASAVSESTFLGCLSAIVAGPGIGVRALDGRSRQPGLGVQRPRGFASSEEVPAAAWVAAPGLPAAAAALLAAFGTLSLTRACGPARELAPPVRASVLDRFSRLGPAALAQGELSEELIAAAGRLAGGVLTVEDLAEALPDISACSYDGKGTRVVARPAWSFEDATAAPRCDVLVVADSRGLVAAAAFVSSEIDPAITIPALGLAAPRMAVPVLRGVRRVSPHTTLPARAPIAIAAHGPAKDRAPDLALGAEGPGCEGALDRVLAALVDTGSLPESDTAGSAISLLVATQSSRGAGTISRRI